MKRKFIVAICSVALLATTLWGCTPAVTQPEEPNTDSETTTEPVDVPTTTEPVTLTTITLNEVAHSVFYAPMYVTLEKGFFEEEGIEVELVTGFGADKTMTALLSNEAEIGFMGPETSIYTYQEGSKDIILNFAQLTQRAGNFLVGREDIAEEFEWADLKGTTVIGGRSGGMPQMVFEYILKQNDLDPQKDLTIVQNIDFGATAAAFSGGQGDFTVEFEPAATKLEQEGNAYVTASLGVDSGYIPYTAFCAKSSYMDANPEIIQGFTNALQRGIDLTFELTPAEVAEIIAPQFPDMDLETLTLIIARYAEQDTWTSDLVFSPDGFELFQDVLSSAGELNARVDYDVLVTTEYAENAKNAIQ